MNKLLIFLLNVFVLSFFLGCGNDNRQNPYIMGEKPFTKAKVYTASKSSKDEEITIAKIEAETQKEIAKINKDRDLELKKIEEETKLLKIKSANEMAIKEHNLSTFVQTSEYSYKNSTLFILSFAIIIFASLALYFFKKYRKDKIKMHEEELQKEVYLREKELQVKMAEKILDTIASGKLSDEKEKHLLEALDKTTTTPAIGKK